MQPWKTLSRQTILDRGKFLRVEEHVIELPDGRIIDDWTWVITPDYINVVAITEEGQFLCFRQTKYSVAGTTLAVVGGYIEPGENPLAAAQRELLEETGYEASAWTALNHYAVDANRGAGTGYAFLAEGAKKIAAINADDLEEQELISLSRDELEATLLAGEFKVMPNVTNIALALLYLRRRG